MEGLSTFSSLTDVLHALSQGLLVPDIILLLLFAAYALFCIGSVIMEYFTERRNFRIAMPKFLNALMSADEDDIPELIRSSGLLNRQKEALLTVYDYRNLHDDALMALVHRCVFNEETRYERILGRNNTAAKISPMLGLMGTLIPLGPGIAALGQADTSMLSASLLVAFDTTVAGLAVAAVCLAIGKIRSNWYGDYLSTLETAMATLLQKIEDMRAAGTLKATEPSDYAFLFEEGLKKEAGTPASHANAPASSANNEPNTSAAPATDSAAATTSTATVSTATVSTATPAHAPAPAATTAPAVSPGAPTTSPAATPAAPMTSPAAAPTAPTTAPAVPPGTPMANTSATPTGNTPTTPSTEGGIYG